MFPGQGRIRSAAVPLAAASALLMLIGGCSGGGGYDSYSGKVQNTDIVGRWTSNCGAVLDATANGGMTFTSFPVSFDPSTNNTTGTYSGPGTWSINGGVGDTDPQLQVETAKEGYYLDFATVDGKLGFAIALGDPDDADFCLFAQS